MKKKEQDILNIIDEKTKDIQAPESLSPDLMEEKLKKLELEQKKKRKKVRYRIGGVIAACVVLVAGTFTFDFVSKHMNDHESQSEQGMEHNAKQVVPTAKDYEEIYGYIENVNAQYARSFWEEETTESLDSAVSTDMNAKMSSREESGTGQYSTTNVRQDGVDEADVVKTDGRYLYVLRDDGTSISIVDTEEKLAEVKTIKPEKVEYIQEFYMVPAKDKLILICSVSSYDAEDTEKKEVIDEIACYAGEAVNTCVITYDVKDVKNPKEEGRVQQSGNYISSRMSDGYVYLFSQYYTGGNLKKEKPETFVPIVDDTLLKAENIYMPSLTRGCMYEVITSIDIQNPEKAADSKAIFSEGGEIYVSNEKIYYYETQWADSNKKDTTTVRKISYKNGKLEATAQGIFDGYVNDSFCIDEYEGNLRVVTTVGETNSVYVLDKNLDVIGRIEGLAKDERVYSARFMGETGYFVTFRETDPLFTVDLSNPKDPQIVGKLKIPGFSNYLHFYGEDKLLGIGMDVDEETSVTEGVKLTMFDISDRSDVKEESTYIMENVYSADVEYDYKAALIDVNKNMIGFAAYPQGQQKYYLFSYDEKEGFVCNMEEEINGSGNISSRGIYIRDILYVVQGNVIESYSLIDYKKTGDLIL